MKKVLKFHTGRGGRFNNSGYVQFVGFETITEGMTMNDLFEQENGIFLMSSGNECDCQINEDGTGYVNEDHDYDTTNCVFENDLNEKQINAILRSDNRTFVHAEELFYIVKEHYQDRIEEFENTITDSKGNTIHQI